MYSTYAMIHAAQEMRPLPAALARLAALVSNPNWEVDDVVRIISFDPGLTAKLLSIANSAASGSREEVHTIDDAVRRLGSARVLSLSLGSCVAGDFGGAQPDLGLRTGELWVHAVGTALAAEKAADFSLLKLPPESFSAALLHDVGKLMFQRLATADQDGDQAIARLSNRFGKPRCEDEQDGLYLDHAQFGAIIAQRWKLPKSIVKGIAYHGRPWDLRDERCRLVAFAVGMANTVAKDLLSTRDGDDNTLDNFDRALATLRINGRRYEDYCSSVEGELSEALALYGSSSQAA